MSPATLLRHINFSQSPTKAITFPLPIADSCVSNIVVPWLATLLPASQIPALIAESYRLLQPGGQFDARLINALPVKATMGPKLELWLEENLIIQLESDFRCSRPCELLPTWSKKFKFTMADGRPPALSQEVLLRAAVVSTDDVNLRVGAAVLRHLWYGTWGSSTSGTECFWWDNDEIVEECLERETSWRVASFQIFKTDDR